MKDMTTTIPEETKPSLNILGRFLTGEVQFECVLLLCHLNGTDPKSFLQRLNR